ncbi:MAG TPA: carboxypeptidase regulatory-like domain-containing protein [Candidatus Acidoferrum sp.]|nr:carboxypeptidase regulatory-like domain-containing protein [Candidatus Acidoferrum sp.]
MDYSHWRRIVLLGVFLSFIFLWSSSTTNAQGIVTGTISGTLEDPQGGSVAGATVFVVRATTTARLDSKTDASGYFEFRALPIGIYTVKIEAAGFRVRQLNNVAVEAGRTTSVGAQKLEIGAAAETVTVEASAPLIDSTSAQIGGTFESKTVQALPNAGAGFDNLVLFIPGVANNGSTNFSNTNGAAVANNGLRGRSNNFQIDGQANNDNSVAGPLVFVTNPDVLEELQVVSNNFSAEYGRNSGTVVNYITKSGTNVFHGSAYEIYEGNWDRSLQNSQKNPISGFCPAGVAPGTTTPYASKCTATVIPRFVDNRFGGTFGGPALRNRVWGFVGYQQEIQKALSSGTSSSLTPTPDGLTALATAFPSNTAVSALQSYGPYGIRPGNPQPVGTVQNVVVSNGTSFVTVPFSFVNRVVGNNFDDRQIVGRGDWAITSKDRFFFRFIYQNSTTALGAGTAPNSLAAGTFVAVPAQDRQYGWDYTRTWSPTFVQQFRVSYGKGFFKFAGGQAFPQCTIENVTACPANIVFSDSVNSYTTFGLATNLPQDRQVHNTQVVNNSTWTRGRHTVKFGAEFDHQNSPSHFLPSVNGGFTFLSSASSAKDCATAVTATNPAGTGPCSAFSNFIKNGANCPGTCSQLSLTNGPFEFNFAENDVALYAQDDWRIKSNLTINLGVRWEWDQQAINLLHDISVKNVTDGFWAAGLPTSVTEIPHIPEDFNNVGPNIGFAWTPRIFKKIMGEDKTVIRGGYRVAYDPAYYNIFLNVATSAPVVNAGTIFNVGVPSDPSGASIQSTYQSQIPTGANPGARSQTRVSPDFHNPYVQQWSLGIERMISSRISFEVRYVGNHDIGNFQTVNSNPILRPYTCTTSSLASCTPTNTGLAVQAPQYIPSGVTPCTPAGAAAGTRSTASLGRPDCNFALVRTRTNGAWSSYHGIQNELKIHAFRGLTADMAYTFSKALDNTSEIFASTGGNSTPIALNPFDPSSGEKGVSAQSYPHVFTTYWLYELPWMKNQQKLVGRLLGGWQLSGTYRYQSGVAVTPVQNTNNGDPYCDSAFNNNFVGSTLDSCRPLLSNPNAPFNSAGRYINATQLINVNSCMSTTLVGTSVCPTITPTDVHFIVNNTFAINALCGGDPFACAVNRNVTRTQPRNQVDLSVQKAFRLTERMSLSLRGDAVNVFNYQFYGAPGLNINNKNATGVTCSPIPPGTARTVANCLPGVPAPNTFGEVWGNTGNNRAIFLSGHITF